jgi:hypothetical protein
MLEHPSDRASSSEITVLQPEPVIRHRIAGWRLDRRYSQSATQRAITAADLVAGVPVQSFTWQEAIAVTGTNSRYLALAKTLSPSERARAEANEITLSGIERERRRIVAEISKVA